MYRPTARRWKIAPPDPAAADLAARLKTSPLLAQVLLNRGLREPPECVDFLRPSLKCLHDPSLLPNLNKAAERVARAVRDRERIVIYGDYDVDGITATVILRRVIELVGGNVIHFVPDRHRDGYGLQPETVERLRAAGAGLIISVDCGIRADEAARRARDSGVDLIITDHHEPGGCLPPALAVINPRRVDCAYPDKHLAGVGVALKEAEAQGRLTLCDPDDPGLGVTRHGGFPAR